MWQKMYVPWIQSIDSFLASLFDISLKIRSYLFQQRRANALSNGQFLLNS